MTVPVRLRQLSLPDLHVPVRDRYLTRRTALDAGVLVVALAAWLFALSRTDVTQVGDYGLLAVLNPVFFVVPILCLCGFLAELAAGARRGAVLVAYLGMVILTIHGTTPALLAEPQYAWTYKHIGVIEYFMSQGQVSGTGDIYQQWPAFFTAVAELSGVSGVDPLRYAAWAPVFFNVVGSLLVYAVARTLSTDRRVAYLTVLLFQCINWIEEDYLSPQGLAFVLSLGVMFIVLRWLRVSPAQDAARTGWLARVVRRGRVGRLRAWLRNGMTVVPERSRNMRVAAYLSATVAMGALTASHQLSPYLVAFTVVVLALLGVVRGWLAWVFVAIPVLYLVPRYGFVSGSFGLFDGFNLFRNAGGNSETWGTTAQAASAITVRILAVVVWILAAAAVIRGRRQFGRLLVPAALAAVPFTLILAQSYGGEAIYRVFLFSAPWCAFLIATLAMGVNWSGRWWAGRRWARKAKVAIATAVIIVMLLATMQGRHGQLVVDQQSAAEVAAAEYLYANALPDSTIMLATPNFPSRIAANYDEFNRSVAVGEPDLVKGANLRKVVLDSQYLPFIESYAATFGGTATYLVISRGMKKQAHYFGYLPDGSLDTLAATIAAEPQWTLFYRNADVVIYQLT